MYKILLFFLLPFLLFGQQENWNAGWRGDWNKLAAGLIPTKNLSLLIDPAFNIISGAENFGGKNKPALTLDTNLVANGDFHDFTMENDVNTIGHWIFDDLYHATEDDGEADIANDVSGNNNDLTPQNFSTEYASELVSGNPAYQNGNALSFDGVDQYLDGGNVCNLGTGDFTIELWVKRVNTGTFEYVISKRVDGSNFWYLSFDSINRIQFRSYIGSELVNLLSTSTITDTNWHHIAIVNDRDTSANCLIYIDSVVSAMTTQSTSTSSLDLTTDFYVGGISSGNYFEGQIAEVRISDVARTAQEIDRSYGMAKNWYSLSTTAVASSKNDNFTQQVTSSTAVANDIIKQDISSLTAGALYKISYRQKNSDTGYVRAFALNGVGTILNKAVSASASFVDYEAYFQGTGAETALWIYGLGLDNDIITFDNISLQKVTNVTTPTSEFVEDFSLGGKQFSTKVYKDFEDENITGFNSYITNTIEADRTGYQSSFSFKCTGDGSHANGWYAYLDDLFGENLTVGKVYKISGWAKKGTGDTIGFYWNVSGFGSVVLTTLQESWTYFEKYIRAGSVASDHLHGSTFSNGEEFWVDNLKVEEVTNGNHGWAINDLEDDQPTHPYAYELDGVDQYIDFGTNMVYGTNDVNIFAWVKFTFSTNYEGIYVDYNGSNRGIRILKGTTASNLYISLVGDEGTSIHGKTIVATNIGDGNWHLLGVHIDRNGNLSASVDGTQTGTEDISSNSAIAFPSDGSLHIGYSSFNSTYFTGLMGIAGVYVGTPPTNWLQTIYNNTSKFYVDE